MLVVALVGLALSGGAWTLEMRTLSRGHARTAQFHRSWLGRYRARQAVIRQAIGRLERVAAWHSVPPSLDRHREDAADYARKADFREALALKYEYAARYPWLPVEPDPPMP
jgi:hypothetical protein